MLEVNCTEDRTGRLVELLEEREAHILRLEARLKEREAHILQLEARLKEREAHILQLEARLEEREARILQLEARLEEGEVHIARLEAQVHALLREVSGVRAQLAQTSRNSHKPPSSDSPAQREKRRADKKRRRRKKGRRAGGQPGHQGASRPLVPSEEADEIVQVLPSRCSCCGEALEQHLPRRPAAGRHQVWEIPPITPHVTEYQLQFGWCTDCRAWTRAELPPETPPGAFGPRLIGLVGLLTGRMRLSKRLAQEFLAEVLGMEVSLGSICSMEQLMARALEAPYQRALDSIRQQSHVYADETGWYERAERAWLWVANTARMAVFAIKPRRNRAAAKELLGEEFVGFLVRDRWKAYDWLDENLQQFCWAHLERDFQGWVDRNEGAAPLGCALLRQVRRLFRLYEQRKSGELPYECYLRRMERMQCKVRKLLTSVTDCGDWRAARTAQDLLHREKALWTFVYVEELEPTNNLSERALRPAVCMRKASNGTYSAAGSRFVERMLTAVTTLMRQGRNVLEYLTTAVQAWLRGEVAPSLVPLQPTALPQPP